MECRAGKQSTVVVCATATVSSPHLFQKVKLMTPCDPPDLLLVLPSTVKKKKREKVVVVHAFFFSFFVSLGSMAKMEKQIP
jgi:hypothetical protein